MLSCDVSSQVFFMRKLKMPINRWMEIHFMTDESLPVVLCQVNAKEKNGLLLLGSIVNLLKFITEDVQ